MVLFLSYSQLAAPLSPDAIEPVVALDANATLAVQVVMGCEEQEWLCVGLEPCHFDHRFHKEENA
jgi:hypothetical protein